MPHVELKYSDNIDVDTHKIFTVVERIVNQHDASAGECKSRAYPCSQFNYPHILIVVSLLAKPHRDQKFTEELSADIEEAIKNQLKQSVYFSLNIEYSLSCYTTNTHLVDGDVLPRFNGK